MVEEVSQLLAATGVVAASTHATLRIHRVSPHHSRISLAIKCHIHTAQALYPMTRSQTEGSRRRAVLVCNHSPMTMTSTCVLSSLSNVTSNLTCVQLELSCSTPQPSQSHNKPPSAVTPRPSLALSSCQATFSRILHLHCLPFPFHRLLTLSHHRLSRSDSASRRPPLLNSTSCPRVTSCSAMTQMG